MPGEQHLQDLVWGQSKLDLIWVSAEHDGCWAEWHAPGWVLWMNVDAHKQLQVAYTIRYLV